MSSKFKNRSKNLVTALSHLHPSAPKRQTKHSLRLWIFKILPFLISSPWNVHSKQQVDRIRKENNHCWCYSQFSFHPCWEAATINQLRYRTISQCALSFPDKPSPCPTPTEWLHFSSCRALAFLTWRLIFSEPTLGAWQTSGVVWGHT